MTLTDQNGCGAEAVTEPSREGIAQEVRAAFNADGAGRLYSATQYRLWQDAHGRHLEHVARMERLQRGEEGRLRRPSNGPCDRRLDRTTETETVKTEDISAAATSATPTISDPLHLLRRRPLIPKASRSRS